MNHRPARLTPARALICLMFALGGVSAGGCDVETHDGSARMAAWEHEAADSLSVEDLAVLDAEPIITPVDMGTPEGPAAQGAHDVCGNGVVEDPEECEEDDYDGMECTDFGFHGGTLRCKMCQFDTVGCG